MNKEDLLTDLKTIRTKIRQVLVVRVLLFILTILLIIFGIKFDSTVATILGSMGTAIFGMNIIGAIGQLRELNFTEKMLNSIEED